MEMSVDNEAEKLKQENERLKQELSQCKLQLQEEQINYITGVPSTRIFFDTMVKLLEGNPEKKFYFIKANIDRFHLVNFFFGQREGDRLLQYFAHRLRQFSLLFQHCILGHFESDNFVILCSGVAKKTLLSLLKKNITPVITGYRDDYILSVSVGIYEIEDNFMPLTLIHSKVTAALKKSKEAYGEYYTFYEEEISKDLIHQQLVLNEIKIAYDEKQFKVYLQPKCNLLTGKIEGAEALIRWVHPDRGIISPDRFIPTLEETGLIAKIDEYVWEVSCQYIQAWIESGREPIPISVNVSRIDLNNPDLPSILLNLLRKYNVPIKYLRLEITESAYSKNPQQIVENVNALHDIGFNIELDDFGTGYSSLNVLNIMKLDTLKLDMSFIRTENRKQGSIIKFIVKLAKQLNLIVVAEGIESEHQVKFLRDIGCEMGQGYFFSQALPKKNFDEFVADLNTQKKDALFIQSRFLEIPEEPHISNHENEVGSIALYEIIDDTISLLQGNDDYYQYFYKPTNENKYIDIFSMISKEDLRIIIETITLRSKIGSSQKFYMQANIQKNENANTWYRIHTKVVFKRNNSIVILTSFETIDSEEQ